MASRRGFLGGLAGGVVAGPAMAKSVLGSAIGTANTSSRFGQGVKTAAVGMGGGHYDHKADAIANIARLRDMSKERLREEYGRNVEERDYMAVVSLRSVSDVTKSRMMHERRIERAHEDDLFRALRRLMNIEGGDL